ncbi:MULTISPECIES: DUF29 domain-containing protein [unclassified Synechocystis]|uniref:DUF29 domain-containing protein n=1 Tax=unclassified Synechocystis TaxID=2640012 RepID=UPI0003F8B252|nr:MULTISPECIES: DUF29 domain-containing protein [unclassified Synechocystis]AIE74969.1 hypothetical protein D082_24410 [Synechocystis sp. PCC 6714]MCT0253321.1 DUF29 domain-containing protein [Synechocystis sp. CS-94]
MVFIQQKMLYEQDFTLWTEETVQLLKHQDFAQVDWDNLIEEIETLGRNERHAVDSLLSRLLEHLLKRCFVDCPGSFRGWEIEIRNFRQDIKKRLKNSPSLKPFLLEIFPESYQDALSAMREDYPNTFFPDVSPFPGELESLLNDKFWLSFYDKNL